MNRGVGERREGGGGYTERRKREWGIRGIRGIYTMKEHQGVSLGATNNVHNCAHNGVPMVSNDTQWCTNSVHRWR
jgi:hypothetical protein